MNLTILNEKQANIACRACLRFAAGRPGLRFSRQADFTKQPDMND
jgi:hypothetical protein